MFVRKINQVIERIERNNKSLEIKCLVSKQEENILWYLALYSDWLFTKYRTQRDRYEMIFQELRPILNPEVLSQFGGVIIFTANDPMKQYLLDNKALLQKHPVGTWIHTPNIGYPWVMWLQSVAKKNNSLLGHNKLKLAVKNKRK